MFPMENQIAFIDEYGNNGLDFEKIGVSTVFIVTAVLIDKENLSFIENQLETIRSKHFQTGEIKSSKVGKNDSRRLKILKEINEIDYHIFSIVVDKRDVCRQIKLNFST
jgi:hypothetical protein